MLTHRPQKLHRYNKGYGVDVDDTDDAVEALE
jgi:hypothetical protein